MRTLRILFLLNMVGVLYAEPLVSWRALWAGAFTEKNITNRAEFRLLLPFDLTVRAQVIDRRPPFFMDFSAETTAFSGALYHKATGSRLLYGALDEWGLPARLRDPWVKSLPFVDYRKATGADLKTEFSAAKSSQLALHLRSPEIGMPALHMKGFSTVFLDGDMDPLLTGGLDILFSKRSSLTVEGLYKGKTLAERPARAWFSELMPLPERDFRIYALGAAFENPFLAFAADWAYSEAFAFGKDSYANIGIRIGNRPWRLSFSVDGAGPRYVGIDGNATGAGFRAGARFEYYGRYSESLRLSTALRSAGIAQPFERSSTQIYYRFPAKKGSLHLSRISFEGSRNAADLAAVQDRYQSALTFTWGSLHLGLSGRLVSIAASEALPIPFPIPDASFAFDSAKVACEIGYTKGKFQAALKAAATIDEKEEIQWEPALSTAIRLGPGKISAALSFEDFPGKFSYTISWRLDKD
ncbi:MAG: hypothetical protein LBB43_01375 [Spirochaetaceae bacterium]|jgi:hypothetical protein|nr:hypothetical protein [Spirochaetaceae bacterium]